MKKLLWLSIAVNSCLASCTLHAAWAPRVTGLGEMGQYGSLWGDGLLPIQDVSDQVVFFDLQAEGNRLYSNEISGIASPGLGVRHAFSNDQVLGFYLFSDYMVTNDKQHYWFLSPGMDFYQGPWYAALNSYIPVNNARREIGSAIPASDLGITQYETFTGNSQYDHFIQTFDTMRWGMDLTGGMLLGNKNEWGVKLGAYLYDSTDLTAIKGVRGELDYYLSDSLVAMVEERYDNVFHEQTLAGFKISFVGKDNRGTVETQLKAPIYRNLNINTTSAGTAVGQYQQTSAQSSLIQNNITFVSNGQPIDYAEAMSANSITGDGTFENPYTGLNQTILNNTTNNTQIWIEGTGANHPYTDATTLTMQPGQSIYGRTSGFKLAASNPSEQPTFDFAPTSQTAALYIGNTNTLQDFIMHGNGTSDSIGVQVVNDASGQTAIINNVTIGSTIANSGYTTALYNQGGNVSINNATLYAVEDTVTLNGNNQPQIMGVFGIYNNGGSTAVTESTISATANQVSYDSTGPGGDLVGAFGVFNNNGTTILSSSTVQATSGQTIDHRAPSGSATSSIIGAFGLYNTKGTMTVTGSASSINATANGVDNVGASVSNQGLLDYVGAFGAYNDGGGTGNTATLDIQQAHLTASATTVLNSLFAFNDPAITAVGVWNNGNDGMGTAIIEQGAKVDTSATWQITSTTSQNAAVNAYGLYNENEGSTGLGSLTADGAIVTATETGGDGSGAGSIVGAVNGALINGHGSNAVTVIKGATRITATGTGQTIPVYGFYNSGSNNATTGTSIEGGSIIDAEGGSAGGANAVFNSTSGTMAIQGTANQQVMLTANGDGSTNNGVLSYNGANTTINYATIHVGSSASGYSLGVNNTNGSNTVIQHATVSVVSSALNAYGVNNDSDSTVTISNSTFNVTTDNGVAYGLWDVGGGTSITLPTTLYLNYDGLAGGTAAAFSSSGSYTDTTNVTCYANGILVACPTQ